MKKGVGIANTKYNIQISEQDKIRKLHDKSIITISKGKEIQWKRSRPITGKLNGGSNGMISQTVFVLRLWLN